MKVTNAEMMQEVQKSLVDTRDLPPIKLTTPGAEFIQTNIDSSFVPAFLDKPGVLFNQSHQLPAVSPKIESSASATDLAQPILTLSQEEIERCYYEVDLQRKLFSEAMDEFGRNLQKKDRVTLRIARHHSWEEVMEEATTAEKLYVERLEKNKFTKHVHLCFQSFQRHAENMEGWLEMIPDTMLFGSVLYGGFKLIFQAATRMKDVKETIFEALAVVPNGIEKTRVYLDMTKSQDLKESLRLHKSVASLYRCSLGVLAQILHWLEQNRGIKTFSAFLKQGGYQKDLTSQVTAFKIQVGTVCEEARLCSQLRNDHANQDLMTRQHRIEDQLRLNSHILEAMYELLQSNPKIDPRTGQHIYMQNNIRVTINVQDPKHKRPSCSISAQALLGRLNLDTSVPACDLQDVLYGALRMSPKDQDRCNTIIQDRRLFHWLKKQEGGIALLHGNAKAFSTNIASTTLVAAQIIESMEAITCHDSIFSIFWFCGQHRDIDQDIDATVPRMLCHLIAELIRECSDLQSCYFNKPHYAAVKAEDINGLCDILARLISSLPRGSVLFCILDWVASMEDHGRRDDLQLVLSRLIQMTTRICIKGIVLKLLLTHPGGYLRCSELIPRENMLIMPEYVPGTGIAYGNNIPEELVQSIDELTSGENV